MLTEFVSIGSYSPEVRTFGTLITSTKVFGLIIICKSLWQNDPLPRDFRYVPRDLTILYLEIVDSVHNNRSLIQVYLAYYSSYYPGSY